jgi:mycothiol synthase
MTAANLEKQSTLPEGCMMRPSTVEDAEAAAYVFTETSRVRGDNEVINPDDIREGWTEPDFDLAKSSRVVVAPDGKIVAVATVWDNFSKPVHPYVSWEVLHVPERNAIALTLLNWCDERAKEAIDRCPPEARISWITGILEGYAPDEDIMKAMDMKPTRYFNRMLIHLEKEPEAPVLPNGISIRTYQHPEELTTLVQAREEAWRDHFGYVERPLDEILKDWQRFIETDKLFDASLWYLAIDDASGEIAGMVLARIEDHEDPTVSYVNIVATRRAWRSQGIAKGLLRHAFREFWQRGRKVITLFVDDTSPTGANRLYEQIGMHVSRQYTRYEKELRAGVELANT